jgi:glycosyltransferase involved in cell wall biosynthesis
MFVMEKQSLDPDVIQYRPPMGMATRVARTIRRRAIAREMRRYERTAPASMAFFTHDQTPYDDDPWKQLPENDLLQLHWISLFVDYRAFFSWLPAGKHVVWTMHGMEGITGGCHYDYGCGKFSQECGACPQLGSRSEEDLTSQVWRRKQESYKHLTPGQLHIVTPSRWLQAEVKRSSLLSHFDCTVIPNGLDTKVFSPRERCFSRGVLGVPEDAKVVLFLADGVDDPRKGFKILGEALAGLEPSSNIFLLSLGSGRPPEFQGFPHLHIRHLQNEGMLSVVYSAADVFAIPSLQDNLPNTILESLACGVPVVAFDAGGIPDAVRPEVTGLLAKAGDVRALRDAISRMLGDDLMRNRMCQECRSVAVQEYSVERQARQYENVYHALVGDAEAARDARK